MQIRNKINSFYYNEGKIVQIEQCGVRKGMWPLIAKHNTSRTNWMNKIEDNPSTMYIVYKYTFLDKSHRHQNWIIWMYLICAYFHYFIVCNIEIAIFYTEVLITKIDLQYFFTYETNENLHKNQRFLSLFFPGLL